MDRRGFLGTLGMTSMVGLLSVPVLGKLSERQVAKVTGKKIENGTRSYIEELLKFFDEKERINNCLILLTNNEDTYKGPKVGSYELTEAPLSVMLTAEPYVVRDPFVYDGVQIVTFDEMCLLPSKFACPVNVAPGDTLHVTWTLSI